MKQKAGYWLKAMAAAFIATGVLLGVLSFLLYKMRWSTDQIQIGIILIYVLANIAGGHILASRIGHQRFVWGVIFGISYFVILLLVSLAVQKGVLSGTTQIIKTFILCVAGGVVGSLF